MTQYFINPCGVASPPRHTLAERTPIPPGATLGLLDNGKTNAGLILEHVSSVLTERFGFADVLHLRKPSVAHPCSETQLQELRTRCAVVVNGVGD